jgi:Flp pilus assembly protein TadG
LHYINRGLTMKNTIHNQRGAVIVIFALSLVVLIGFVAIGTEIGRWYTVRAELAKAVDAAALAGAANISNPTIDVVTLAEHFGTENFRLGYLGTPSTGTGSVSFTATRDLEHAGMLTVTGRTTSVGVLSRLFGVEYVPTSAMGIAQKNRVEIMLILDRSGSMAGSPLSNLKTAARAFLGYYEDTQNEDKIGLVTFATGVSLRAPATNFFTPITNSINAMVATGATNAEDALAQGGSVQVFPDQRPLPRADRIQQFIVFFTDGRPTAFRSNFTRSNRTQPYDRVVMVTGNCDSDCGSSGCNIHNQMGYPNNETLDQTLPYNPTPTGDGLPTSGTSRTTCRTWNGYSYVYYANTKWGSFSAYPVPNVAPGYEHYPEYCSISSSRFNGQNGYICRTARQMAIDHAEEAKERLIKIYTIGLGNVDAGLLSTISSGDGYAYVTPSSSELEAIFRRIASDIKLRLVQ